MTSRGCNLTYLRRRITEEFSKGSGDSVTSYKFADMVCRYLKDRHTFRIHQYGGIFMCDTCFHIEFLVNNHVINRFVYVFEDKEFKTHAEPCSLKTWTFERSEDKNPFRVLV